jgi:hypothetical protein
MMTEEYMYKRLLAARLDKPPAPKPKAATILTVAVDRKLSVDSQRERVAREVAALTEAERNREIAIETHRQRMERQRAEGLYYQQLYQSVSQAEYFAKQLNTPARHGHYDEMARFEREMKDGV